MYCTATVHLVRGAAAPVPDFRYRRPGQTRRPRRTANPTSAAALTSTLVTFHRASVGRGGSAIASSQARSSSGLRCAAPRVTEKQLGAAQLECHELRKQLKDERAQHEREFCKSQAEKAAANQLFRRLTEAMKNKDSDYAHLLHDMRTWIRNELEATRDLRLPEVLEYFEARHDDIRRPGPLIQNLNAAASLPGSQQDSSEEGVQTPDPKAWSEKQIEHCVQDTWGYQIKDFQLDAAYAASAGRDCVIRHTTGAGKSLCFQVIALLDKKEKTGLVTVVVEPFIETMRSQVASLEALPGVGSDFACFLGSAQEDPLVQKKALQGKYPLVYMTPETFSSSNCWRRLKKLERKGLLRLVAVDEVQCVVEQASWRPSYSQALIRLLLDLDVPKMVLSASMLYDSDYKEIRHMFKLDHPGKTLHECRGQSYRRNIDIEMRLKKTLINGGDIHKIFQFVEQRKRSIVYVRRVCDCEQIYQLLHDRLGDKVVRFHKGGRSMDHVMDAEQQSKAVGDFRDGKSTVMVATIALCMGVDIPDVDGVVAYDPRSITELFQQMGRGGRGGDDVESTALVFFSGYMPSVIQNKEDSAARSMDFDELDEIDYGIDQRYRELKGETTDYKKLDENRQRALVELFSSDKCYWQALSLRFDGETNPDISDGCGRCSACWLKKKIEQGIYPGDVDAGKSVWPILHALNGLQEQPSRRGGVKLGALCDEVKRLIAEEHANERVVGNTVVSDQRRTSITIRQWIRRLLEILRTNGWVDLKHEWNGDGKPYCIVSATSKGRQAKATSEIKVGMTPLVKQMFLAEED